jgi:hypothetical protein
MKKIFGKKLYVLVLGLISVFVFAGCSQILPTEDSVYNDISSSEMFISRSIASTSTLSSEYEVIAGQNKYIGKVVVSNTQTELNVEFMLNDPWKAVQSHLDLNIDTYVPGQYQYKKEYDPSVNYDKFTLALPSGTTGKILLHLSVINVLTGQSETAWAVKLTNYTPGSSVPQTDSTDTLFTTKEAKGKWYGYILYTPVFPPIAEVKSETAWAYASKTFIGLNISTRWGWIITFDGNKLSTPIYAAAGKNDITKGTLVGTLTVEFLNEKLYVSYSFSGEYYADVLHMYYGQTYPTIAAPGQYPAIKEGTNIKSYTFEIPLSYTPSTTVPLYIAAHSNVYPF